MFEADMPEPPDNETLPEVWAEAGFFSFRVDGTPAPLSWSELQAFAAMSGVNLPPILWRTVRAMSAAYVAALNDDNPLSIRPSERNA
jgi:hypothetical protein